MVGADVARSSKVRILNHRSLALQYKEASHHITCIWYACIKDVHIFIITINYTYYHVFTKVWKTEKCKQISGSPKCYLFLLFPSGNRHHQRGAGASERRWCSSLHLSGRPWIRRCITAKNQQRGKHISILQCMCVRIHTVREYRSDKRSTTKDPTWSNTSSSVA